MQKDNELTLTEDQVKVERGSFQTASLRTSYLNVNNEGSDSTDADGTDTTDSSDTESDADTTPETVVTDADGEDKRM